MELGARTVEVTDDGGHTGLVAHGGGKVDRLLWVILWEAANPVNGRTLRWMDCRSIGCTVPLYLSPVTGGPLAWQECQRTVAWCLELPVRHLSWCRWWLVVRMSCDAVQCVLKVRDSIFGWSCFGSKFLLAPALGLGVDRQGSRLLVRPAHPAFTSTSVLSTCMRLPAESAIVFRHTDAFLCRFSAPLGGESFPLEAHLGVLCRCFEAWTVRYQRTQSGLKAHLDCPPAVYTLLWPALLPFPAIDDDRRIQGACAFSGRFRQLSLSVAQCPSTSTRAAEPLDQRGKTPCYAYPALGPDIILFSPHWTYDCTSLSILHDRSMSGL